MTEKYDDSFYDVSAAILKPDQRFFALAAIYGIGIGFLTLSVPIAVQALLNTVVNTALMPFIVLLALLLFTVLFISAVLTASRDYAMELFQRRFFARIASEVTLRLTHADQPYMDGINRAELVNRFFEIMHVQKNVPALLTDGFFIALQTIIGMIVVSFYHPFLFVFNVLFATSLFMIWRIWSKPAIEKALALSDSKYALVQWLEELARVNQTFKSERAISFALEETNEKTTDYLMYKKSYFRTTFSQNIAFLSLYCIASATLLGLGGILVAGNQLSMGQLVGAELIMSAIFYSTSKLGYYARIYYDLRINLQKLSYFFKVPLEALPGVIRSDQKLSAQVVCNDAGIFYRGHRFSFDCTFHRGSKILAKSTESTTSKIFVDVLKGHRKVSSGSILIDGQAIDDIDLHYLRNHVLSIDSTSIVEGSIKRLFDLYTPNTTRSKIISALQLVELHSAIDVLPQGLDTQILPSGYPLLQDEVIRLKLAAVIAANPSVLIITEVFDVVPFQLRKRILQQLFQIPGLLLILFTNKKEWNFFDQYLVINKNSSVSFTEATDMKTYLDTSVE